MAGPRRRTDRGSDAPSYCSECGTAVDPTDSFCAACGNDLSLHAEPRTAESSRIDDEYRRLRRRVSNYVADGWSIQYDTDDEVVLVDRNYGSIPVHVLLFLFTGGLGNLVYGWYHYSHSADRVVLRADGEDYIPTEQASPSTPSDDSETSPGTFVGHSLLSLFLLLVGIGAISSPGTGALVFGIAMVLASLYVFPPTKRRLRNRHPPTNFGPTQSVDERIVTNTDRPCSVCADRVERGVVREYRNEYAVAGIPLYTIEEGKNWYCQPCRQGEPRFDASTAPETSELDPDGAPEEGRRSERTADKQRESM